MPFADRLSEVAKAKLIERGLLSPETGERTGNDPVAPRPEPEPEPEPETEAE